MRLGLSNLYLVTLAFAVAASGQTKISGKLGCQKPIQQHAIQTGERRDHSFVISQFKCNWLTPWIVAGVQDTGNYGQHSG